MQKTNEETFKKQITTLEKENKDLNTTLIKTQRGISPFKVQSRSQYQMIDDLQDAINSKGAVHSGTGKTDDDLRNNYNQYIAGSRTQKNNNTAKHGNHSVVNHSASNSNALTNQTLHMFKSHGSTERVNSSTNPKSSMVESKYKKEFLKSKASNREVVNRSAMNVKNDSLGLPLGKSPDRSKNMSVYSQ